MQLLALKAVKAKAQPLGFARRAPACCRAQLPAGGPLDIAGVRAFREMTVLAIRRWYKQ